MATSEDQDRSDDCRHEDAVKWNPYNHAVQCHRCGQVFAPEVGAVSREEVNALRALYARVSTMTIRYVVEGYHPGDDTLRDVSQLVQACSRAQRLTSQR